MSGYSLPKHRGFVPHHPASTPRDHSIGSTFFSSPNINCSLPFDPSTKDIHLERETVRWHESGEMEERVLCNVRWSVVDSSPDGFEWGYRGSAPSDLALNILNMFVPPATDGFEPVRLYDGIASHTAVSLRTKFTNDFLAHLPRSGGIIEGSEIEAWIESHRGSVEQRFEARTLPSFFSQPHPTPIERACISRELVLPAFRGRPTLTVDHTDARTSFQESVGSYIRQLQETRWSLTRSGESWASAARAFYDLLVRLGRQMHAIDVELFRAEVRGTDPVTTQLTAVLPTSIQEATCTLLDAYREATAWAAYFAATTHTRDFLAALGVKRELPVKAIPFGPSVLLAVENDAAFYTIVKSVYSQAPVNQSEIGAFCVNRLVNGQYTNMLLIPTAAGEATHQSHLNMRKTLLHERQHALTSFAQHRPSDFETICQQSPLRISHSIGLVFFESLKGEIISHVVEGTTDGSALQDSAHFRPGGLYDFPRRQKAFFREQLATYGKGLSDAKIEAILENSSKHYFAHSPKILKSVGLLSASVRDDVPTLLRALELLPTVKWPRYISEMRRLYSNFFAESKNRAV